MSSFEIIDVYLTSAIFTIWFLPLLGIAADKTVPGNEKVLWVVGAVLVSWIAWLVFAMTRSNQPLPRSDSTMNRDHKVFDLIRVLFKKLSAISLQYKWLVVFTFFVGAFLFVVPSQWRLLEVVGSTLFTVASFLLLVLLNRANIQPVVENEVGCHVGLPLALLAALFIFTACYFSLSMLAIVAYFMS